MTLPDERYRAVKWAGEFLIRVAGGIYPRVPKQVRDEARSIIKHYPTSWDLNRAAAAAPDIFQEQMEPLYRMIKQYEEDDAQSDQNYEN